MQESPESERHDAPSKSVPLPPRVDPVAQMRGGHVQIEQSDQMVMTLLREHRALRRRELELLEMGAGAGYFTARLAREVPGLRLTAQEDYAPALAGLRARLAPTPVEVFTGPLRAWTRKVDVVLTKGALHHANRDDLAHIPQILADDGILVVCDEFCPEFLTPPMQQRLQQATRISFDGGWLLTSDAEVEDYREQRRIPRAALEMERARKHALWHWYRHVVDEAMRLECFETAVYELGAARDDLVTEAADERKHSASVARKELELLGFECRAEQCVDPLAPRNLQSFHIFVFSAPTRPGLRARDEDELVHPDPP